MKFHHGQRYKSEVDAGEIIRWCTSTLGGLEYSYNFSIFSFFSKDSYSYSLNKNLSSKFWLKLPSAKKKPTSPVAMKRKLEPWDFLIGLMLLIGVNIESINSSKNTAVLEKSEIGVSQDYIAKKLLIHWKADLTKIE